LLSFAAFRFHGLGCGEFPVSVGLGTQGARMQFTTFPDRCTTGDTWHGQYLFRGEFLGFHSSMMQPSTAERMLNNAQFLHNSPQKSIKNELGNIFPIPSKRDHLWSPDSEKLSKRV